MLEVLGLKRGGRGGIFYLGPSGAHHGKTFGVISGLGRGLIFRGVGWLGSGQGMGLGLFIGKGYVG